MSNFFNTSLSLSPPFWLSVGRRLLMKRVTSVSAVKLYWFNERFLNERRGGFSTSSLIEENGRDGFSDSNCLDGHNSQGSVTKLIQATASKKYFVFPCESKSWERERVSAINHSLDILNLMYNLNRCDVASSSSSVIRSFDIEINHS